MPAGIHGWRAAKLPVERLKPLPTALGARVDVPYGGLISDFREAWRRPSAPAGARRRTRVRRQLDGGPRGRGGRPARAADQWNSGSWSLHRLGRRLLHAGPELVPTGRSLRVLRSCLSGQRPLLGATLMVHRSGAGKMPERASFDLGPGWQQVRVTFQDLGTAGEDVVGFLICATAPGGFAIEIADVRLWR